jgi:uncharacterized protein
MALILIRANDKKKLLNGLADLERHANLKITGKPRMVPAKFADEVVQKIIKQELRSKSKNAVIVKVEEETTQSIMQVKKIHPPAHIVVLSDEYKDYSKIERVFKDSPPLKGYYSHKDRG